MVEVQIANVRTFFDSAELLKKIGEAKHKQLSKFGAFVRRAAQTSMRPAAIANKKEIRKARKEGSAIPTTQYVASLPGEPPRTRDSKDLRRFLTFGYEEPDNVVIGPTLVGGRLSAVPSRLEYGGELKMHGRIVKVAARPYMRPAFEREKAKAPLLFGDSL